LKLFAPFPDEGTVQTGSPLVTSAKRRSRTDHGMITTAPVQHLSRQLAVCKQSKVSGREQISVSQITIFL
jgi:hypothetical protein